ncbi:helix-turn-helix domain-containing protein [Clostridium botulinum]|uniref:Helix-turn-helix domain-containing protein n=1 Tax=Clostridium botulinum TaxID=1491 RepID=A0A6M0SPZ6_CLOBO|nr:helix-turn-helix domain-containing protein [Clostridium botulinum]MBY6860786.1 helix-turn-helix domain-containing protein [Clostridium botulinum]MBY7043825.1 helix-turn-helix domain-containing protein [Clostridium botulinum]NFA43403.1 helix-turn-helix domain-containing protein [Clostridium botulinum]NFO35108.1 helix-turn-helix domain-containing protein [Clostridium botulinum]NFO48363.1 helix-turn-helix domain-containing protein [Clostridium botulinum]
MEDSREIIIDFDKSALFVPFHISLMENEKYNTNEKMVYMALKSFCINATACYPNQAKIMKRAGIKSNKTLTTILNSLEEKGVILVVPEFDNNNRRKSNTYYLAKYNTDIGDFVNDSLDVVRNKKVVADAQAEHLKQGIRKKA